jgi:lipid-A-disaccharide synthase
MRLYIIAGEASGDVLGAGIVNSLRDEVEIFGIGGPLMKLAGFQSLFDIRDIAVNGLTEVLPHAVKILKRIKQTEEDIKRIKPDIVLTIDSPGFCFRIAKRVRKKQSSIKLIHLVAPSVWAWRPRRAKSIAKIYDRLLTLFDFEPKYFEKYSLDTIFVGHPAIETFCESTAPKHQTILIMPGSRRKEITTLLPIFLKAADAFPHFKKIIPTTHDMKPLVEDMVAGLNVDIVSNEQTKISLFSHAQFAITANGTAVLHLALSGCPMIVCYKMSRVTFAILKRIVTLRWTSLINIILNQPIVTELIQNDCNPENIKRAINEMNVDEQKTSFRFLKQKLSPKTSTPSQLIITAITSVMKTSHLENHE